VYLIHTYNLATTRGYLDDGVQQQGLLIFIIVYCWQSIRSHVPGLGSALSLHRVF
jgi:hypothetical protein